MIVIGTLVEYRGDIGRVAEFDPWDNLRPDDTVNVQFDYKHWGEGVECHCCVCRGWIREKFLTVVKPSPGELRNFNPKQLSLWR